MEILYVYGVGTRMTVILKDYWDWQRIMEKVSVVLTGVYRSNGVNIGRTGVGDGVKCVDIQNSS